MNRQTMCMLMSVLLLAACGRDAAEPLGLSQGLNAHHRNSGWSEWSEPVNLGPVINSAFLEQSPMLSKDGRTLYFMSDRLGGVGGNDLWAAHRACKDCPWETPINLAAVNGPQNENGPSLSRDGHLLFFQSNRVGSQLLDIYMTSRADRKDDQGWGPALQLGPDVNTALRDVYPNFLPIGEGDAASLYFSRGPTTLDGDIFVVSITRDGATRGPAERVSELNDPDPAVDDSHPSVRTDGKEIIFRSNRPGSLGGGDLWVSVRRSVDLPWSAPVNLGAPLSSAFDDVTPTLSFDGRTLLFVSSRPGGEGGFDIWMSTRTREGHDDEDDDDVARYSGWSAPVNLGPIVNSTSGELEASVSKDGLSLYISSSRSGNFDIWVSRRESEDDPWGAPQNIGAAINTGAREQSPFLSRDGHRLYFMSDRTGGAGGLDLYVSRRHDKHDDLGWEAPENLGLGVNSDANENVPVVFEDEETETTTLYFTSNRDRPAGVPADIYASTLQSDGTFGPAGVVPELSSPGRDRVHAIRRDGLEIFLGSDVPGATPVAFDIWVATRSSTSVPWSTPVNLGPVLNSAADDTPGALSFDGTTLYIISGRPGTVGNVDLWVSTRTKLKGSH